MNSLKTYIKHIFNPYTELKEKIQAQQDEIDLENEKRRYVEYLLLKIIEDEQTQMPIIIALEVWEYLHSEEIKSFNNNEEV